MVNSSDVTLLLERANRGDDSAAQALFPLIYQELRALAGSYLRQERADHTLQPTALVHEAYLKLVGQQDAGYRSRGHFMAVAATAMRRILVNHAKARAAHKRGGKRQQVPFETAHVADVPRDINLVALDEAMNKLAAIDERKVRVVEQRFFAGLELQEIADGFGVSLATVKRDWEFARTWLLREIQPRG